MVGCSAAEHVMSLGPGGEVEATLAGTIAGFIVVGRIRARNQGRKEDKIDLDICTSLLTE